MQWRDEAQTTTDNCMLRNIDTKPHITLQYSPSMSYLHDVERFVHDAVFFAEVQSLLVHGSHAHPASTQHTLLNKSTKTLQLVLDSRSACALAYAHWFTLGFGPCTWGDAGTVRADMRQRMHTRCRVVPLS